MKRRVNMDVLEACLEYGVDIQGRRIFFSGDVTEESVSNAVRGMYLLDNVSKDPIELFISSDGGSMEDAYTLHDVTRTIDCEVHTIALGKCMSAAPLLVACGTPGHRWAGENTTFMLHDATLDQLEGSAAYLDSIVQQEKVVSVHLSRLLASYTTKDARHWSTLWTKKGDTYFGTKEALEWGLIDQVWDQKNGE